MTAELGIEDVKQLLLDLYLAQREIASLRRELEVRLEHEEGGGADGHH